MPFTLQKLPDEPIILYTLVNYNYEEDGLISTQIAQQLLDEQTGPVFLIADMREAHPGFDDMIKAVNISARQFNLFRHPNVCETLIVTRESLIALAAKGLDSAVFGKVKLRVFGTLDEAIAYTHDVAPDQK